MAPNTPDLAQDLIRIHKVITRSIDMALTNGNAYLQNGSTRPEVTSGYKSYTHCLVAVLDSHHLGEDLIAFPELRKAIPNAPYDRLTAEHHEVEKLLAIITPAIAKLDDDPTQSNLRLIVETLKEISELWPPHYQTEEHYFSTQALAKAMDPNEQGRISAASSKYSQEHSEPPYWVVPFVLYNLEYDERMRMAAFFPPVIMDELIPKVWKDQWAPMKPYLLD